MNKDCIKNKHLYNSKNEVVQLLFFILLVLSFFFCYSACVVSSRSGRRELLDEKLGKSMISHETSNSYQYVDKKDHKK